MVRVITSTAIMLIWLACTLYIMVQNHKWLMMPCSSCATVNTPHNRTYHAHITKAMV
jgi:hypothetical protein